MKKKNTIAPRKGAEIPPKDWQIGNLTVIPCPFCGQMPRFNHVPDSLVQPELKKGFWALSCANGRCGGFPSASGDSKKDAAFQWNQRSSGGWVSPKRDLPDAEICVLIRTGSEEWPLALGWYDGEHWLELSSDRITASVMGWMHMEDAAGILDTIAFTKKGGAK